MQFRPLAFLLLLTGLLSSEPARAQNLAVSGRAGTLGPGFEMSTSLDPHFNVRMGINHLDYSRHDHLSDLEVAVDVTSDVKLTSFALIADVLPFERIFRMSLGLIYNHNEVESRMVPAESYTVEGKTFSPERIGTMQANVQHRRPIQPYMGIGFGNPLRGKLTVLLDVGMIYTDAPRLQMQGTGMIAPTARQAPDLEASLYSFRWYPVAAVGIGLCL